MRVPPYVVIYGLPGFTLVWHYLMNGMILGKKFIVKKHYCYFPLQLLSETFLILRRIQPDIVIYVYGSSCKSNQYSCQIVINFYG